MVDNNNIISTSVLKAVEKSLKKIIANATLCVSLCTDQHIVDSRDSCLPTSIQPA